MLNSDSISIKLGGVKFIPSDDVKYLGVHLDKYHSWDLQTNQLSKKLSRANDILSKLRHFAPKKTLISVYYSIFYTYLLYDCLVWSLRKPRFYLNLAKWCLRIINFAPFSSHTNNMFFDSKLLMTLSGWNNLSLCLTLKIKIYQLNY